MTCLRNQALKRIAELGKEIRKETDPYKIKVKKGLIEDYKKFI